MLETAENPISRKIFAKAKICNGSLFENIAMAASKKDRAVLLSDLHCSASASELHQDKALYPRTGGCFKTYQVNKYSLLQSQESHS